MNLLKLKKLRDRRKKRVRKKLNFSENHEKKRVCFTVTNRHLYAQLIDIASGKTLMSVSTMIDSSKGKSLTNCGHSKRLADSFWKKISKSQKTLEEPMLFDRGSRLFHGKVKVFADTLREKGLKI